MGEWRDSGRVKFRNDITLSGHPRQFFSNKVSLQNHLRGVLSTLMMFGKKLRQLMSYCSSNESSDLCFKKSYYFKNSLISASLWEVENATDVMVYHENISTKTKESCEIWGLSLHSGNISRILFQLFKARPFSSRLWLQTRHYAQPVGNSLIKCFPCNSFTRQTKCNRNRNILYFFCLILLIILRPLRFILGVVDPSLGSTVLNP